MGAEGRRFELAAGTIVDVSRQWQDIDHVLELLTGLESDHASLGYQDLDASCRAA